MGGKASRDKGARTERAIVHIGKDHGFAAERIPLSGAMGGTFAGDVKIPIGGRDHVWEVKCLADGFKYDYDKLSNHDALVKKADNKEPLITLRLKDYLQMAKIAETAPRAVVRCCTSTKSEDGGSCGRQVPCDGRFNLNGAFTGGCGEPCRFVMQKPGEGMPPFGELK